MLPEPPVDRNSNPRAGRRALVRKPLQSGPEPPRPRRPGLYHHGRVSARRHLLLALALGGCALEQKMSLEVIDAPLRTRGVELRAADAPRGEIHLGPYTARGVAIERSSRGESMLPTALPRPSLFLHLTFELVAAADRTWRVDCRAERRQARNTELASETDERRDEVALACTAIDPQQHAWTFTAGGDVGRGLFGEVRSGAPRPIFEVEVIVRRKFIRGVVDRELPIAVAQLRRDRAAAAAMLLDSPERAWLAPKLPDDQRELALAVMLALRLLPLGLADG